MYKFLDLNLNEIPFPEGVMPLDIFVGSISKVRETEQIPGRPGTMNYGVDYESRPVNVTMLMDGNDKLDYRIMRNEVYAMLDAHDVFYVAETDMPSRVLKVAIDESIMPDRVTITAGKLEIPLRTLDSVFWESIYTTMDLHDSGFSSTPEKYGLVDNIDINKVNYRLEPENTFNSNLIPLQESNWEQGARWSSGTNDNNSIDIRMKVSSAITIKDGQTYTLNDNSAYNSRIGQIMVHCFDNAGNMTYYFIRARGSQNTFTAKGTKLVISFKAMDGFAIPLDYIEGDRIQIKLEEGSDYTGVSPAPETFTVYNAGNVTVEPESMKLDIIANTVNTDGGFTIKNITTGETFIFEAPITNQSLIIRGVNVIVSSVYNRFRDCNKKFIRLVPGENKFEVSGGTFNHIRFDFKYYYK